MVFRNFDTENVINEVRSRECLWNPRDVRYSDKYAKQRAWKEICLAVVPKYSKRLSEEQSLIVKAVQARWKTARDAYMKCRYTSNKKPTYRAKSNYIHYNILTFLEQVIEYEEAAKQDYNATCVSQDTTVDENTSTGSNHEDDADEVDFNIDIHDNMKEEINEDSVTEINPEVSSEVINNAFEYVCLPETSKDDNEQDFLDRTDTIVQTNESFNSRRKKRKNTMSEFETRLLKIMSVKSNINSTDLHEDDQYFFNSLAPLINNFNNHQKLNFRSKILEFIREVENEHSATVKQEKTCVNEITK